MIIAYYLAFSLIIVNSICAHGTANPEYQTWNISSVITAFETNRTLRMAYNLDGNTLLAESDGEIKLYRVESGAWAAKGSSMLEDEMAIDIATNSYFGIVGTSNNTLRVYSTQGSFLSLFDVISLEYLDDNNVTSFATSVSINNQGQIAATAKTTNSSYIVLLEYSSSWNIIATFEHDEDDAGVLLTDTTLMYITSNSLTVNLIQCPIVNMYSCVNQTVLSYNTGGRDDQLDSCSTEYFDLKESVAVISCDNGQQVGIFYKDYGTDTWLLSHIINPHLQSGLMEEVPVGYLPLAVNDDTLFVGSLDSSSSPGYWFRISTSELVASVSFAGLTEGSSLVLVAMDRNNVAYAGIAREGSIYSYILTAINYEMEEVVPPRCKTVEYMIEDTSTVFYRSYCVPALSPR